MVGLNDFIINNLYTENDNVGYIAYNTVQGKRENTSSSGNFCKPHNFNTKYSLFSNLSKACTYCASVLATYLLYTKKNGQV